jgi:hypothetical protein
LTLTDLQFDDSGSYTVIVADGNVGVVESDPAMLDVMRSPFTLPVASSVAGLTSLILLLALHGLRQIEKLIPRPSGCE